MALHEKLHFLNNRPGRFAMTESRAGSLASRLDTSRPELGELLGIYFEQKLRVSGLGSSHFHAMMTKVNFGAARMVS